MYVICPNNLNQLKIRIRSFISAFAHPWAKSSLNYIFLLSGIIKNGEPPDPYKFQIIVWFAIFQFVFMVICLIPTWFMFNFEFINVAYLVLVILAAVFNGGSYYIQIFSQRYNAKFIAKTTDALKNNSKSAVSTDKLDNLEQNQEITVN